MPIREFACPKCGREQEHYLKTTEKGDALDCRGCQYHGPMQALLSKPAPHQLTGRAGQLRSQELIRKRNKAWDASSAGKERSRWNIESMRKRGLDA